MSSTSTLVQCNLQEIWDCLLITSVSPYLPIVDKIFVDVLTGKMERSSHISGYFGGFLALEVPLIKKNSDLESQHELQLKMSVLWLLGMKIEPSAPHRSLPSLLLPGAFPAELLGGIAHHIQDWIIY